MKQINLEIEKEICELYKSTSIETLCEKFKIGDRRIKTILKKNGIQIKNSHQKTTSTDDYIEKNTARFNVLEGFHYVAVSKIDQTEFADYLNKSGALIQYIKNNIGIEIPSLFKRKKYFHENGKQWYEQWFDIVLRENNKKEVKVCPYCGWETVDVENKSGMFMTHLLKEHNITIEQHLQEHPEDVEYFKKQNKIIKREKRLEDKKNFVVCPICGERFEKLTYWHIKYKHNLEYEDFKALYPECEVISDNMLEQANTAQRMGNLVVSKNRFTSKYERDIQDFLSDNGVSFSPNRQMLIGREIDLLIEDKKIGIEFDGLKWHTEWFGKKSHNYHLEKTKMCNEKGYGLIHIFEDEYIEHKDIVLEKLTHILNIEKDKEKAYGRKCAIKEILKHDAESFLNRYHIQGFSSSSIYLGAYYKEDLVGVMTFKNGNLKNLGWELTRFATNSHYKCTGIGGKLFSFFIKNYAPHEVYSFADRRWTVNINSNLYTKLGFKIGKINPPDYKYYTDKGENKNKRLHKMLFNKQKLHKKYNLPLTMTETEMAKALGYDRIWDCGLIKYVWENKNA